MIAFGDSYSSTGSWAGGDKPSASNPIGNPAFPGSTYAGGINWVGFSISKFNASLTLAYNFAEGGATTDSDIVAPYSTSIKNFDDHVNEFITYLASHPDYAPWTAGNTFVAVWIGINDIGEAYWDGKVAPVDEVMDRYFELLQVLYDAGIRNFRLLNVPPFNKAPVMEYQSESSLTQLVDTISDYNSAMEIKLMSFKAANTNIVSAEVVDTHPIFNVALANPSAYGAADATCYNSDGTTCLWWDNYQPGYQIHRLVAQAVTESMERTFF